jgi:hypothetical protein
MPISLPGLLVDVSSLAVDEKRRWADEAVEIIGLTAEWKGWNQRLESFLGPAQKPAGKKPSPEQERRAEPGGGIRKDQIYFERSIEGRTVVALVWPWGDNTHFTLKLYPCPD